MTTIPELVTAQDYEGLVKFCENFELTVRHTQKKTTSTVFSPCIDYNSLYYLGSD
jgi:hypothetical protein